LLLFFVLFLLIIYSLLYFLERKRNAWSL